MEHEISTIKQSLLLLNHDLENNNETISVITVDTIPPVSYFQNTLSSNIPNNYLQTALNNLRDWSQGKISIHSRKGYGGMGGIRMRTIGEAVGC